MSLLYDPKLLIQQLRAKYLENVNESIGERVIGLKNSTFNKKKRFESIESILDHENDISLFVSGKDTFLNNKDIGLQWNDKLSDIFHDRGYDAERSTKCKYDHANVSLSALSAKVISNNDESNSDDSELLFTNHLSINKVKFKPKSADIVRRNSKDDLSLLIKNYYMISGYGNKHVDNYPNIPSKDSKNSGLIMSYSNEVLNKSLKSICQNDSSFTLSNFDKNNLDANDTEESCLNNAISHETMPKFSRKLYQSSQPSSFKESSLLTILIKSGMKVQVNPLADIFACFSGKGDLNPLKLKIYRPSGKDPKKPISVVIKRIATVADAIGFSLYCFIEQKLEPKLTNEQLNPNMWTLRIVEEEGELDDDFPALDRARFLSKFGFDEFALVEATPAQFLENEKITPFNFKINTDYFNSQTKKDDSLNDMSKTFSSSVSSKGKAMIRISEPLIPLKIQLYPLTQPLQYTILHVTNGTYIGDVLNEICKKNNLDQTKFILRTAKANIPLSNDFTVHDLKGGYELELIERNYFMIPEFERSSHIDSIVSFNESFKLNKIPENTKSVVLNRVMNNSYHKYIVWRRQSMSFMGRHERILVIDNDYVYIMPSEQKTFFETPKTLSIHASMIVSCKQTDKLSTFKFTIMKSKELKRYDFEASTKAEASIIVGKINALINSVVYSSTKIW